MKKKEKFPIKTNLLFIFTVVIVILTLILAYKSHIFLWIPIGKEAWLTLPAFVIVIGGVFIILLICLLLHILSKIKLRYQRRRK